MLGTAVATSEVVPQLGGCGSVCGVAPAPAAIRWPEPPRHEIGLTLALWKALTPPLSGKTPTAGLVARRVSRRPGRRAAIASSLD